MWWKLAAVSLLAAAVIFMIGAPLLTIDVSVTLPDGGTAPAAARITEFLLYGFAAAFMGLVLWLAIWMSRRIIRAHKA